MIKARLRSVEFVGGVTIPMNANSVIVIVGPNNSGKSAALASIRPRLSGGPTQPSSLTAATLLRESTLEEIKCFLASERNEQGRYQPAGHDFHENNLADWWDDESPNIGQFLTSQVLCELTTRARLGDCDPPESFDARNPFRASHPFQKMYRDSALEERASNIFRIAFQRDLIVHRAAGNSVPIYIGERPTLSSGEDRISRSYLARVEALERIEAQGDGIRSFASIIGRVITESRSIQIIDEPEAFLPPPQARLVARSILSESVERQTIVATHSSDILRGLLSSQSDRVSVVRLTRSANIAKAHYLEATQIANLWRDPILRFSNILDGLFHDGVIITEADADCRFYEALAVACVPELERPDFHYTYSGGKDRLPVIIRALVALKVPVVTIVDFDVLNNDMPLRSIVEAHGGLWEDVSDDWQKVKAAVEASSAFTSGDQFRREVTAHLSSYGVGTVAPKATLKSIRNLTRSASPWDHAKNSGLAAVPTGGPTVAAKALLETLKSLGIFVAPNGEMEGFYRSIGGHGPRWVEAALQQDLGNDPEFLAARTFVLAINAHLRLGR